MKYKKKLKLKVFIISVICFIFVSMFGVFAEPTQQFNKLFLNPFYTSSTTKDTNTSFSLPIYPSDKISSVLSAIVNFDVWMNPSVNFTLLVNEKSCNTPSYYISTTYASAGKTSISFDCSNIINKEDTYQFKLKANKDTGAMTGFLDLTYMNNPKGVLELSGTEYSPNDPATIFVQLKDSDGLAISNGSCYLDIYYPLTNGTHPYIVQDAPMLSAGQDDGFYYYDLFAPSQLGVYMLGAKCSYAYNWHWLFEAGETAPVRAVVLGTYVGGVENLQAVDNNYEQATSQSSGGSRKAEAYYLFNASDVYSQNITNVDIWYAGESSGTPTLTFQLWNFRTTNWTNLPNTLSIVTSTASTSNPSGVDYFASNTISINVSDYIGNSSSGYPYTIWVRVNANSGSTFVLFSNWLNVRTLTAQGTIQDVKGSGEMHITNIPNSTANLIQNLTLNINHTLLAQTIWNYTNRSLTFYEDKTNYTNVAQSVWGWMGNISSSILGFFTNDIWSFANRTLTFYEDKTNYSKVAEYVWIYGNRNLTFYEVNNISASEIWNYMSRNLTFTEDMTNYSKTAEYVWLYVERNLTTIPYNNISAEDVWNWYNRSLTQNISMDVWNYPNRNLTYDIPFEVWSYSNRTLTYYTINLTELIEMISNYTSDDIPVPFLPTTQNYQIASYTLNVTLVMPYFAGSY